MFFKIKINFFDLNQLTNTELDNNLQTQLYNLHNDIGEKNNLADKNPEVVKELSGNLQKIKSRTIKKD